MSPFHFVLVHVALILGVFLIVIGWTGILSGTAFIHRSPFGLHRPLVYVLAFSMFFFEQLNRALGAKGAQVVLLVVALALLYETARLMLVPYVAVTGASAKVLDADIRDAFAKLHVKYRGGYPRYETVDPEAEFKVRFSRLLGQGDISVTPRSQWPLLRQVEGIIDTNFSDEEEFRANRGFISDIFEGIVLCGLAIWQLMKHG